VSAATALLAHSEPLEFVAREACLRDWAALEPDCNASAFLSSPWVGAWLATLPAEQPLRKLIVTRADEIVALGVFGSGFDGRWPRRRHSFYLHATGDADYDSIFIEQNGLLVRQGYEAEATSVALRHLFESQRAVEQFRFDAVEAPDGFLQAARSADLIVSDFRMAAPYVDLASLRESGSGYVESLGKKARYAVRSACAAYAERFGALSVDVATAESAPEILERLGTLSKARHQGHGNASVFQRPFFNQFHTRLIGSAGANNLVELLTVRAGNVDIGHLYLLRHRNRISFYQCGYDYALLDQRAQPGYAVLSLAIEHYLQAGYAAFDFLAEATPYKLRLARASRDMAWLRFRRPTLRNRLEEIGRQWRHRHRPLDQRA